MSDFPARFRKLFVPNNISDDPLFLGGEYQHTREWSPDGTYITCTSGREDFGTGSPLLMNPQYATPGPPYRLVKVCQDEVHPGPPYLSGGPFRSLIAELKYDSSRVFGKASRDSINNTTGFFRGADSVLDAGFTVPPEGLWDMGNLFIDPSSSPLLGGAYFPDLSDWGERAFHMMKPKIAQMNGFEALYESRDLGHMLKTSYGLISSTVNKIPGLKAKSLGFYRAWNSIKGRSKAGPDMRPEQAANHFLNHQFGWRPFINDLSSISNLVTDAKSLTEELSNRNGKPLKRRVHLNREHFLGRVYHSDEGNFCPCYPVTIPWKYLNGNIIVEMWDEWSSDIFATGVFSFYLPEFDRALQDYNTAWRIVQRYLDVYGVRLTPSTIWSVIPWAWLVSWLTNLGKQIDYLSSILSDSVIALNTFVMRKYTYERKLTISVPFINGPLALTFSRTVKTKQRDGTASPYGFSLSKDLLSPRQLAIIGAIGVTHQRRR